MTPTENGPDPEPDDPEPEELAHLDDPEPEAADELPLDPARIARWTAHLVTGATMGLAAGGIVLGLVQVGELLGGVAATILGGVAVAFTLGCTIVALRAAVRASRRGRPLGVLLHATSLAVLAWLVAVAWGWTGT